MQHWYCSSVDAVNSLDYQNILRHSVLTKQIAIYLLDNNVVLYNPPWHEMFYFASVKDTVKTI